MHYSKIKSLVIKNKGKLIVFPCFFLVCVIMQAFGIPCVIKYATGIPCIGCGMTRALKCALFLDFKGAFEYHSMFWSLPIIFIIFIKDGLLFKNKALNVATLILLLSGFIANWISKIL